MSNSNNSGSSTGGTIHINSGTVTGTNGVWVVPNQTYTITIGGGGGGGAPQNPFIGIDWAVPVEDKKEKSDGCSCKKCKEFFEYAEPNQEDGTLICWACRHGY